MRRLRVSRNDRDLRPLVLCSVRPAAVRDDVRHLHKERLHAVRELVAAALHALHRIGEVDVHVRARRVAHDEFDSRDAVDITCRRIAGAARRCEYARAGERSRYRLGHIPSPDCDVTVDRGLDARPPDRHHLGAVRFRGIRKRGDVRARGSVGIVTVVAQLAAPFLEQARDNRRTRPVPAAHGRMATLTLAHEARCHGRTAAASGPLARHRHGRDR